MLNETTSLGMLVLVHVLTHVQYSFVKTDILIIEGIRSENHLSSIIIINLISLHLLIYTVFADLGKSAVWIVKVQLYFHSWREHRFDIGNGNVKTR